MQKRTIERLVFIIVAVLTVGVMLASINFERRITNQKLLFYQLQALRTSINLFKAMERRNPESIAELARAHYRFPEERQQHRYIDLTEIDEEGRFLDPFGHPYRYDAMSGWVRSSTPGYEYW